MRHATLRSQATCTTARTHVQPCPKQHDNQRTHVQPCQENMTSNVCAAMNCMLARGDAAQGSRQPPTTA
eukprot:207868-Alexandrium_andersonii.AAC.1